jgi:hypothetical protein
MHGVEDELTNIQIMGSLGRPRALFLMVDTQASLMERLQADAAELRGRLEGVKLRDLARCDAANAAEKLQLLQQHELQHQLQEQLLAHKHEEEQQLLSPALQAPVAGAGQPSPGSPGVGAPAHAAAGGDGSDTGTTSGGSGAAGEGDDSGPPCKKSRVA